MRPDAEGGRPQGRVGARGGQVGGVALNDGQDGSHVVDGVHAPLRARAVAGAPTDADVPTNRPLVTSDDCQAGGLGDDGGQRQGGGGDEGGAGQAGHAGEAVLLVDGAGQGHPDRPGRSLPDQAGEGGEHGRHAPLDVAGAAAIEPAPFDSGGEGVNGHMVDGDGVLVGLEEKGALRTRGVVEGDDVVAPGGDRLPFVPDPEVPEQSFEMVGYAVLEHLGPLERATHGVEARQGDEVAEQTSGLEHRDALRGGCAAGDGDPPSSYPEGQRTSFPMAGARL